MGTAGISMGWGKNQAMRSTRMVIIPSTATPTLVYDLKTKEADEITDFDRNKSNNNLLETLCMFT